MDIDDIAVSLLGSLGLLGATLGAVAAIRRAPRASHKGICQSCGGRGFKECTLCYGKGCLGTPGYVNFADPRHTRICKRCDGSKTVTCTACGEQSISIAQRPGSVMRTPRRDQLLYKDAGSERASRTSHRRRQHELPAELQDDDF